MPRFDNYLKALAFTFNCHAYLQISTIKPSLIPPNATSILQMTTNAQRRLLKDLQRIQKQPGDQIIASPLGENLLRWTAAIEGIEQTAWQGGIFQLRLDFTENYPNKAPLVRFTSKMFHPNIYNDGRICLDMLQNQWSPVYDVWSILTAVRLLLADPNTLSPANCVACKMFKENKSQYEMKVRELVERSLQPDPEQQEFQQKEKQEREMQVEKEEPQQYMKRRPRNDRLLQYYLKNEEEAGHTLPSRRIANVFQNNPPSTDLLSIYRKNYIQTLPKNVVSTHSNALHYHSPQYNQQGSSQLENAEQLGEGDASVDEGEQSQLSQSNKQNHMIGPHFHSQSYDNQEYSEYSN